MSKGGSPAGRGKWTGFFDIKDAAGLREKLRRDLTRLAAEPLDSDRAFNFMVTAEHLLDWVYPGDAGKTSRTAERNNSPLLQLVSHLANGAKHFAVEHPRHSRVEGTETRMKGSGLFANGLFDNGLFWNGLFGYSPRLVVDLGPNPDNLPSDVVELAEAVIAIWDQHPGIP